MKHPQLKLWIQVCCEDIDEGEWSFEDASVWLFNKWEGLMNWKKE